MQAGKKVALALTVTLFAATWISPLWPLEQAMHGSLAVIGLILLLDREEDLGKVSAGWLRRDKEGR